MGAGHSNDEPGAVHASDDGIYRCDPAWRTMSDEAFLADCTMQAFRASGPGGQKRNKTSSAVRLVHRPTAESAIASESRSQHDNRRSALRRLRHRVVLVSRQPIHLENVTLPARIDISTRNEAYLPMMGLVLDVLASAGWSLSGAAKAIGVTTGALGAFLQADRKLFLYVNEARLAAGLKPLGAR